MISGDPFDDALEAAGSFGRAQFVMIFLVGFITAYLGWQACIPVFAGLDIDFKCTEIPHQLPEASFVELVQLRDSYQNNTTFGDTCIDNCQHYEYKIGTTSIVSEFDLACGGKHFLVSFSNSIYWIAFLLSCFVSGFLADKFGRKWVSFTLIIILSVSTAIAALSPNIYVYIALRFAAGFCIVTVSYDYIILAETMDKKRLSTIGITTQMFYVIGVLACILSGFLLRNCWKWQFFVMSIPPFIYTILHFLFMPESPRWLHSKGKFDQAEKTLKWIARMNGRDPISVVLKRENDKDPTNNNQSNDSDLNFTGQTTEPEALLLQSQTENSKPEADATIFGFFGTASSSIFTCCCCLQWFACSFVYYGLMYDVQNIGGNLYVNSCLLSVTDAPSWLVCVAMNRYGRKPTFCVAIFISSLACAVVPFMAPVLDGDLQIAFAMIAKCFAAGAFDLLYVYTPEVFPTVLRSTGLTMCSANARVAIILSPFVIELNLGPYNCAPYLMFGLTGLLCCLLCFIFGIETRGKAFLTTLDEFYLMAKTKRITVNNEDQTQNE